MTLEDDIMMLRWLLGDWIDTLKKKTILNKKFKLCAIVIGFLYKEWQFVVAAVECDVDLSLNERLLSCGSWLIPWKKTPYTYLIMNGPLWGREVEGGAPKRHLIFAHYFYKVGLGILLYF